jgi:hypothetical protein
LAWPLFFSFPFYPIRNFPFCHSRVVSYFLFHSDKNLRAGQTAAAAAAARADYPPATSAQQRYMQMLCGATNRLVCLTNKCLINVNIKLAKKGQNGKKEKIKKWLGLGGSGRLRHGMCERRETPFPAYNNNLMALKKRDMNGIPLDCK